MKFSSPRRALLSPRLLFVAHDRQILAIIYVEGGSSGSEEVYLGIERAR
jgi:hypothetical protein